MAFFSKWFAKRSDSDVEEAGEVALPETVLLKPVRFNLNDTLREVANLLAGEAQEKGISIVYWVDKNVPSVVIGDRYKLGNILTELIGNAIDFTNRREDVAVRIRRNARNKEALELHFEVADAGIGMSEALLEQQVLPMLRSDQSASAFGLGTVGLQRARDIVHAMGGSITMQCREAKGCHVSFYVHFMTPDMKERRHYRLPNYRGVGRKTLVVDDDAGSAHALKLMLEYFRHTVTLGSTDDLAEAGKYDIVMVASAFWSETAALQSGEESLHLVVIENMLQPREQSETMPTGAVWRIGKPFTQQAVYEMLLALYSGTSTGMGDGSGQAPEGVYRVSRRVGAFLDGERLEEVAACEHARRLFAAEEGLHACEENYGRFIDQLQEFIWKYVKADRVVGGMIEKGDWEETAAYCREMQERLLPLGLHRLACCCALLAQACDEGYLKDIEELDGAFGALLVRTIAAIDRFVEEAKYKEDT